MNRLVPAPLNRKRSFPRLSERGFTLVELMIAVLILAIITPAITYLFLKVQQGMASDDMHLSLTKLNETNMLHIHETLGANRHFFQADGSGVSFVSLVAAGMPATTKTMYPILAGSLLATQQPISVSGSFSPVTAVKADFGNSILMAVYDAPQTFGTKSYNSPATVAWKSGASSYVTYGGGAPATVLIHLYRFYYYYLTTGNSHPMKTGGGGYRLVEWQSIQFADFNELNSMSDGTLENNVAKWLATAGNVCPSNPTYALTYAWDPTQSDPTNAFYSMSTGGLGALVSLSSIPQATVKVLTQGLSGILSSGFGYGVSPNSSGWTEAPATVPLYGVASGKFPGGFEVGISGSSAGRQVLIRQLLVAKGGAPKISSNDQTIVNNVRDTW